MQNKEPLVSVIMNCYNCDSYLKEAIDSVYAQTYKNWEIIFWDNASTDKSAEVALLYGDKLRYFHSDKNKTLGCARKLATEEARGKYLAFLDCDDLWCNDKLEKQISIFEENKDELGIVYGRSEIFYDNLDSGRGYVFKKGERLPEGMVFEDLIKENFIQLPSAVVDKSKFFACGGFPPHLECAEDYWIFICLAHDYPVAAVQEVCCKYRIHSNNLSKSISIRIIGILECIEVLIRFLPNKAVEDGIKRYYMQLATLSIKGGNLFHAISVLTRKRVWWIFIKNSVNKIFLKLS